MKAPHGKRVLCFLIDENIHLKNRLSNILKAGCAALLLVKLEVFQTSFICTDTLLALLRNDLADFEKKLETDKAGNLLINNNVSGRVQRMRRNICAAVLAFHQRQSAFNDYLEKKLANVN